MAFTTQVERRVLEREWTLILQLQEKKNERMGTDQRVCEFGWGAMRACASDGATCRGRVEALWRNVWRQIAGGAESTVDAGNYEFLIMSFILVI